MDAREGPRWSPQDVDWLRLIIALLEITLRALWWGLKLFIRVLLYVLAAIVGFVIGLRLMRR